MNRHRARTHHVYSKSEGKQAGKVRKQAKQWSAPEGRHPTKGDAPSGQRSHLAEHANQRADKRTDGRAETTDLEMMIWRFFHVSRLLPFGLARFHTLSTPLFLPSGPCSFCLLFFSLLSSLLLLSHSLHLIPPFTKPKPNPLPHSPNAPSTCFWNCARSEDGLVRTSPYTGAGAQSHPHLSKTQVLLSLYLPRSETFKGTQHLICFFALVVAYSLSLLLKVVLVVLSACPLLQQPTHGIPLRRSFGATNPKVSSTVF